MEELKNKILQEIKETFTKEKALTIEHGIRLHTKIVTLRHVLKMIEELEKKQ